ncbi:hypothetical protein CK203_110734 [Vitis vinifera]|uniref:Uncharacterized protein n=1 Tax=Vitis vinifera TaxID=29760 RepID=A0A438FGA6_VITVI|nr:hypothetical protein CK203_110734 [Vitis vinifera]
MSSLFTVLSVLPTSPILTPFSLAKLIYNSKALPKVKVFAWFVANKDNTNDLLQSRRPYKALGQDQCIIIANLKWVPLSGIVEKLGISFEGLATYLEGSDLEEEMYVKLPSGFEETLGRKKDCKLEKSSKAWFAKFMKSI